MAEQLSGASALIIHHRRHREIIVTVKELIQQGLSAENVLVIDNSEDEPKGRALAERLPDGVSILFVKNEGYGAAVNFGARQLAESRPDTEFVLVMTHEVRFISGSPALLFERLKAGVAIGAVGPLLVSGPDPYYTWSEGGRLSRVLALPSHRQHGAPFAESVTKRSPSAVDWLDGACVAFRLRVLLDNPFRHEFFMYCEEMEQQARIRASGLEVQVVPGVVAWQSSSGVPLFTLGRNLQLFLLLHGNRFQRVASVRLKAARELLGRLARADHPAKAFEILRGRASVSRRALEKTAREFLQRS